MSCSVSLSIKNTEEMKFLGLVGEYRQAILKYVMANYKVGDEKAVNNHLKMALKSGMKK